MATFPTADQITALAPDSASIKAGRGLAVARKWSALGADADALWGLAQGSGKNPYQTRVALADFASKCSCPSRKFPCKHAIGLMLIAAGEPAALTESPPPAWVGEWLNSRTQRQEKAQARLEQKIAGTSQPVDAAAQAKRIQKRESRVDDGVALLSQWLADLARRGLADSQLTDPRTWDDIIRRMVDAQATGLAFRLRRAADAARRPAGGESRVSAHLGRLHLLLQSYANRHQLDDTLRTEIEQQVGWTIPRETVLTAPTVPDTWLIAARTVHEEDRLVVSQTWLHGCTTGRWAQIIRSSPVSMPTVDTWPPGRAFTGELCFYPGVDPLRALWKSEPADAAETTPTAQEGFSDLVTRHAAGLGRNPWRTTTPALIRAQLGTLRQQPALLDASGIALPLEASPETLELLQAILGGALGWITLLWDGYAIEPLAVADEQEWVPLTRQSFDR